MHARLLLTTSLTAAGLLACASPALAQQGSASPAATPAAGQGLGEIVVTAEKRPSLAQKTPISMSVLTGDTLVQNGVTDVNQLSSVAPTLNIAQSAGATMITIRGVSSRDYSETGDPAVAVSIDNFYLQRALGLNAAMFDLERVEVLNGPQGTLYGRNATAGAVNIQTAKPVLGKTSIDGYLETGNYGAMNGEVAVNLPVTDTLAVRVAAVRETHQGYRDNSPSVRGDDQDVTGARVHVLWKPTTRFSALLTGEITHSGGVGTVIETIPYASLNANGSLPKVNSSKWALNAENPYTDITTRAVRGQLSYDFGPFTLSYYGGYQYMYYDRNDDSDGGTSEDQHFHQNEHVNTQNHEVRLTSNGSGPLSYTLGGYYFRETDSLNSEVYTQADQVISPLFIYQYAVMSQSKAVFGQVGYQILPKLKIDAGIRYTQDNKSQIGPENIIGVITDLNNHYSGSKVTWHAGATYQLTPRNMLYFKADSGYKAGGYTVVSSFGPETITAYEAGTKNRFFGNRLELNLSGFLYDYKNLQTQYADGSILYTINAGAAKVYGGEAEMVFKPNADNQIDFNASYLHARYTDFIYDAGDGPVNYDGNRLPQAPTWSIMAGVQHTFHLLKDNLLTFRAQTHYQTSSYFEFYNYAAERQAPYTKTDLTLTWTPPTDHFTVTAFVHNLENSTILTNAVNFSGVGGYTLQFADPRTYGARINFHF